MSGLWLIHLYTYFRPTRFIKLYYEGIAQRNEAGPWRPRALGEGTGTGGWAETKISSDDFATPGGDFREYRPSRRTGQSRRLPRCQQDFCATAPLGQSADCGISEHVRFLVIAHALSVCSVLARVLSVPTLQAKGTTPSNSRLYQSCGQTER